MPYRVRFEHDPHPISRGGSIAIIVVSLMHMTMAVLLMFGISHWAADATSVRAFLYVIWYFGFPMDYAPAFLFGSATLALTGVFLRLGWLRLHLFMLQHLVLGIMFVGGMWAAYKGHYLDGTMMSGWHIFADRLSNTALFVVHTSAIMRRVRDPNG